MLKCYLLTGLFLSSFTSIVSAADLELGIYELNRGEFKDAMAQFQPLVEEGYSPAQFQVGLMYLNGWGVKKSPQKAFELFSLSATQNYPDALFALANMYSEGEVTKKDLKTAFALMEKAAEKELARAQFNLGVMYYNGEGTKKNNLLASRWYRKAAEQNYALAQFNLALMYFNGEGVEKSTKMSYIWNIIAANNGYADAVKSRDMDEHQLDIRDIEVGRLEAEQLHNKIIERAELKARLANEKAKYPQ
ncbi:tetratricopeptide repeat protein [Thalassotalea sp. PLHSN55]|uniref:tetratricopeptide repeat protein n=1 Tax=Thalassotalea sp. PLHSN55 TaxID=3435888 RepID=UPI003F847A9C